MNTQFKVEISNPNGTTVKCFDNYKDALDFYADRISYHNIYHDDAEWPAASTEVELSAGGRNGKGYSHRIDLLESNE